MEDNNNSEVEKCCICGKPIDGFGNDPYPYVLSGLCCNECNIKTVIPYRIAVSYVMKARTTPPVKELTYDIMMRLNRFFRRCNFIADWPYEEGTPEWRDALRSFTNQYLDGKDELFIDNVNSISYKESCLYYGYESED